MTYTIQVSNHREAGLRIPTESAEKSWETIFDGPIATPTEARRAVDKLAVMYRHVRIFRDKNLYYAVHQH